MEDVPYVPKEDLVFRLLDIRVFQSSRIMRQLSPLSTCQLSVDEQRTPVVTVTANQSGSIRLTGAQCFQVILSPSSELSSHDIQLSFQFSIIFWIVLYTVRVQLWLQ